ncbi:5' nucleotidase, NT5C type [Peribacillus sp. B-H-3]|uniref:5' nucleotidase, NT5C type n=1 Tax=Peribacillus sp. B-H-3 TaxID=3400420 RepID=UPI003B022939
MKKRFGIDIDGTVTRPDAMVPFINKDFQMNLAYEDITEYDLTPFVHVPPEDFSKWFSENEPLIYAESPIAEGAKKVLGEWMHSADLYFISARHSKLLQITEEWFKAQGLGYHQIELIGSHDKVETAKRCKVDLFLEDKHDNAVAISEQCKIPVILFDTPYNRLPVPDSVIRVHTWLEAEQWVKNWMKQSC